MKQLLKAYKCIEKHMEIENEDKNCWRPRQDIENLVKEGKTTLECDCGKEYIIQY